MWGSSSSRFRPSASSSAGTSTIFGVAGSVADPDPSDPCRMFLGFLDPDPDPLVNPDPHQKVMDLKDKML